MEPFANHKILYVSSIDVSIGNGPGVNEREFVEALHQALGPRAHFLIPKPEQDLASVRGDCFTFSKAHHQHHPLHFVNHVISQMRIIDQLISRFKPDLLIYRLDFLPLVQYYIALRHRIPYVIKALGQGGLRMQKRWLGNVLLPLNRWLLRSLMKGALGIDAVSEYNVQFFIKEFCISPERILWVDNAVNTDRFWPTPVQEARHRLGLGHLAPIVGYVGGSPTVRGGVQLVELAPALLKRFPQLGIVIVGDDKNLRRLKWRADKLGISEHCVFPGHVSFDLIPNYINSFDVCISLNLEAKMGETGMSELKVRQYLACGKPVVCGPGSNNFVGTENLGSIVSPDELPAVQKEIERWLLMTPKETEELRSRAVAYVTANLSVKISLRKRFEFWDRLLVTQSIG